jgi:hypothetical protein
MQNINISFLNSHSNFSPATLEDVTDKIRQEVSEPEKGLTKHVKPLHAGCLLLHFATECSSGERET